MDERQTMNIGTEKRKLVCEQGHQMVVIRIKHSFESGPKGLIFLSSKLFHNINFFKNANR